MKRLLQLALLLPLAGAIQGASVSLRAQQAPVSLHASIARPSGKSTASRKLTDFSSIVAWLTPLDPDPSLAEKLKAVKPRQIVQRNKTFEPHLLVVPVGARVEFPNKDPFFHNIFSLYDGRRFDLGLYEAGTTRTVVFDRPGVSFLFCNIHAEMSAAVLSLDTPYFAVSDRSGNILIDGVPAGRYQLHLWYEKSAPEYLRGLTRTVTVSDSSRDLGSIQIQENPDFSSAHKNKYGLDYVPPPNTSYDHP